MIEIASRGAELSPCGQYRYQLTRTLADGGGRGPCTFIMLNPSTADHTKDDPTIRRCLGYVSDWGYDQLRVVNLFAWRATWPRDLFAAIDPTGVRNDWWIERTVRDSNMVVAAWGAHGTRRGRGSAIRAQLGHRRVHCLGLTADGQPRHPLYVARAHPPELLPPVPISLAQPLGVA